MDFAQFALIRPSDESERHLLPREERGRRRRLFLLPPLRREKVASRSEVG